MMMRLNRTRSHEKEVTDDVDDDLPITTSLKEKDANGRETIVRWTKGGQYINIMAMMR